MGLFSKRDNEKYLNFVLSGVLSTSISGFGPCMNCLVSPLNKSGSCDRYLNFVSIGGSNNQIITYIVYPPKELFIVHDGVDEPWLVSRCDTVIPPPTNKTPGD